MEADEEVGKERIDGLLHDAENVDSAQRIKAP
jgi:hypothetical protein